MLFARRARSFSLRLIVTGVMWLFMTGLIGLVNEELQNTNSPVLAIVIMMMLALNYFATRGVWSISGANESAIETNHPEKRKHHTDDARLETLLALMDADEREAFKVALKSQYLDRTGRLHDDGEVNPVSLDTLIRENRNHHYFD